MSVFLREPKLHVVFMERYKTLWHLGPGLAASFLLRQHVVTNMNFLQRLIAAFKLSERKKA